MTTLSAVQRIGVMQSARRSVAVTGAVLIYATVLFYLYRDLVSPSFAYAGLTFREPDADYPIVVALTVLVALLLPKRIHRASDFIQWVLFVMMAAPAMLTSQYTQTASPPSRALTTALMVAMGTLLIRVLTGAFPLRILNVRPRPREFWATVGAMSVLTYAMLIQTVGLSFRYLALLDVYNVRADFGAASSGNLALIYLLPVQYGVINPLLMGIGIIERMRAAFLVGALGQTLIYLSTGQKAVLFTIPVAMGIAVLFRRARSATGTRLLMSVALVALSATVLDKLTSSILWSSLLVRRFLIIPGVLVGAYFQIFADLPKTQFSDVLGTASPYAESPTHIVGAIFVNSPGTAANVSFFGHGFVSYGYTGVLIECFVVAGLLIVADCASARLSIAMACILFLMPTVALASSSVFTATLTHGFLAAIVVALLVPERAEPPAPRLPLSQQLGKDDAR